MTPVELVVVLLKLLLEPLVVALPVIWEIELARTAPIAARSTDAVLATPAAVVVVLLVKLLEMEVMVRAVGKHAERRSAPGTTANPTYLDLGTAVKTKEGHPMSMGGREDISAAKTRSALEPTVGAIVRSMFVEHDIAVMCRVGDKTESDRYH